MIGQAERVLELQRLKNGLNTAGSKKIVTFTSGKGGTGKTFVIMNLAFALAQRGLRILLIDLDTNLSNINILIDYHPRVTLFDFLKKKRLFEETIVKYGENLDIIFGDSGKTEYPEFNGKLVEDILRGIERVEENYDFILVDTASGAGPGLISLLGSSDLSIIITTPEPTAVMDAYVLVKLLKVNGYSGDKVVIFNKCLNKESGETGYNNLQNACSHFLGENIDLLGGINYNADVMQSIIDQKLLITENPNSVISEQIRQIGGKFLKYAQVANIGQAASR